MPTLDEQFDQLTSGSTKPQAATTQFDQLTGGAAPTAPTGTLDEQFEQLAPAHAQQRGTSKQTFDPTEKVFEITPTWDEFKKEFRRVEGLSTGEYISEFGAGIRDSGLPWLTQELPAHVKQFGKELVQGDASFKDQYLGGVQNAAETGAWVGYGTEGKGRIHKAFDILTGDKSTEDDVKKMWRDRVAEIEDRNERLKDADSVSAYEISQFYMDPLAWLGGGIAGKGLRVAAKPAAMARKAVGLGPDPTKALTKAKTSPGATTTAAVLDPVGTVLNKIGGGAKKVEDMTGDVAQKVQQARGGLIKTMAAVGIGGAVGDVPGMIAGAALSGGSIYAKSAGGTMKAAARVLREGDTGEGTYFKRISRQLAKEGNLHAAAIWGMADKMGVGRAVETMGRLGTNTVGTAMLFTPVNYFLAGADPQEAAMLTSTTFAGGGLGAGFRELARGHLPSVWKNQYFNLNARLMNQYKDTALMPHLANRAMEDSNALTLLSFLSSTDASKKYVLTDSFAREVQHLSEENTQQGLGKTDKQIAEEAMDRTGPGEYRPGSGEVVLDVSRPSADLRKVLGHEYAHFLRGSGILDDRHTIGMFEPETTAPGETKLKAVGEAGRITEVDSEGYLRLNETGLEFVKGYAESLGSVNRDAFLSQFRIDPETGDLNVYDAILIDKTSDEFTAHVAENMLAAVGRSGPAKGRLLLEKGQKKLFTDKALEAFLTPFRGSFIDSLMVRAGIPIFANPESYGGKFKYSDVYGNTVTDSGWRYMDAKNRRRLKRAISQMPLPTSLLREFNKRVDFHLSPKGQSEAADSDVRGEAGDQTYSTKDTAKNPSLQKKLLGTHPRVNMDTNGNITGWKSAKEANKIIHDQATVLFDILDSADTADASLFPAGSLRKTVNEAGQDTFEGQYIQDWVMDGVEKSAVLLPEQVRILKEMNERLKSEFGEAFRVYYRKAISTKSKTYQSWRGRYRDAIPTGIGISQGKGNGTGANIYIRNVDMDMLNKNIEKAIRDSQGRNPKRKFPAALQLDKAAIYNAIQDYMTNHNRGYKGDGTVGGRPTNGEAARKFDQESVNFLNELLGVRTKGNVDVNALFRELEASGVDSSKNLMRSFRLERMGDPQPMPGLGKFSFRYGDVKANFSGEAQTVSPDKSQTAFSGEAEATNTKAFKDWFKDSKVTDEAGQPQVVYHGSNQEINEFKKEFLGLSTKAQSAKKGFFFVSNPDTAKGYGVLAEERKVSDLIADSEAAGRAQDWNKAEDLMSEAEWLEQNTDFEGAATVEEVYLKIEKPFVFDAEENRFLDIADELNEALDNAIEGDYDGVVIKNLIDNPNYGSDTVADHFVVFEPTQVKSATRNVGTFDPNNPDIRYSGEAEVDGLVETFPLAPEMAPQIENPAVFLAEDEADDNSYKVVGPDGVTVYKGLPKKQAEQLAEKIQKEGMPEFTDIVPQDPPRPEKIAETRGANGDVISYSESQPERGRGESEGQRLEIRTAADAENIYRGTRKQRSPVLGMSEPLEANTGSPAEDSKNNLAPDLKEPTNFTDPAAAIAAMSDRRPRRSEITEKGALMRSESDRAQEARTPLSSDSGFSGDTNNWQDRRARRLVRRKRSV